MALAAATAFGNGCSTVLGIFARGETPVADLDRLLFGFTGLSVFVTGVDGALLFREEVEVERFGGDGVGGVGGTGASTVGGLSIAGCRRGATDAGEGVGGVAAFDGVVFLLVRGCELDAFEGDFSRGAKEYPAEMTSSETLSGSPSDIFAVKQVHKTRETLVQRQVAVTNSVIQTHNLFLPDLVRQD